MISLKKAVLTLGITLAALTSGVANASLVSFSSLTRDTSSDFITDTLNDRQWLGWDATKGKTLAQVEALTAPGQAWAGFQVAHNVDAQLFMTALSPAAPACSVSGNASCFSGLAGSTTLGLVLGENYTAPESIRDYDIAVFLSDNQVDQASGYILLEQILASDTANLSKTNEYNPLNVADSLTTTGNAGWLFYRDGIESTAVPEPASLALAGLGLAGLFATRRRRLA